MINEQMPSGQENLEVMGQEEAQEEANMMKIKLREVVGHEPTVADYDEALRVVEEMKKRAATETDEERASLESDRKTTAVGNNIVIAVLHILTLGARPTESDTKFAAEQVAQFDDAEMKLNKLRAEAQKEADKNPGLI